MQKVKDEIEWKRKSEMVTDEAKMSLICVGSDHSCEENSDLPSGVCFPALKVGVEGIWNVSPVELVGPSVVPAHFYKHIFWHAEWPLHLSYINEFAGEHDAAEMEVSVFKEM